MDAPNVPERPKPSGKSKPSIKSAKQPVKHPKQDTKARDDSTIIQDPNYMFKTGFLAGVYNERPISDQIPRILTRMPPEPNVSCTCQIMFSARLGIDCCPGIPPYWTQ
jgi:glutaminyl-tRNA synthetase